jgi:Ca-activated chloride channel family protein
LVDATDVIGPPAKAHPDKPNGAIVLLSDGETTVGRPTTDGAQAAADAKIPVYSIAFGTANGTVADPDTGQIVPVPVNNDELAGVATTTGGTFYKAPTAQALEQAYTSISKNLNAGVGDPVQITKELTWQFMAAALAFLGVGWLLGLVLLRGLL